MVAKNERRLDRSSPTVPRGLYATLCPLVRLTLRNGGMSCIGGQFGRDASRRVWSTRNGQHEGDIPNSQNQLTIVGEHPVKQSGVEANGWIARVIEHQPAILYALWLVRFIHIRRTHLTDLLVRTVPPDESRQNARPV